MFTAKHLLRFAAALFFFGLVFSVAAPARADDGVPVPITNPSTNPNDRAFNITSSLGTITITNPTDREFSITVLGPSFSRSVSAHAGNRTAFTGLLAGIYSYDSVRLSDGAVTHGQVQLAVGGTQTITAGAPALTIAAPGAATVAAANTATEVGVPVPITNPSTNPNDRAFNITSSLGTVIITNPTDREFSITVLGPSFSRSVSAHAGNRTAFTGLLAGIYSYDLVRLSDGAVTHGQFVLAEGGTQTITAGAPALTIPR